jgi:hypothetical protein
MASKTKFAYVAKKTFVRLKTFGQLCVHRFWAEKKLKKYLEVPKSKMTAQFKVAAEI